ncbi:MAG: ABC transporter permease, partial [Betaproteobacteria bacterium]
MSAILSSNASPSAGPERSEGVWAAAWRRYKADRVGMVSLVVVLIFMVLIAASALDLVAKDWQKEVGVPNAPPTLLGPAPPEATGVIEQPKGPNVDISAIDPLAPKYAEWAEKAKTYATADTV